LIECAGSLRNGTFIAVLWESGCRIGELLTLTQDAITFDEYGSLFRVTGKTGTRPIRIVEYADMLKKYLKSSSSIRVFKFGYASAKKILQRAAWEADIKKNVSPHSLRHSSATFFAPKITSAVMEKKYGWVPGSRATEIYLHLSNAAVDGAILKGAYGIEKRDSYFGLEQNSEFEEMRKRGIG